ncbi:MAG: 30S ribosome-binding factor RbfA [Clostridia bacterium]|nr:30S ribosome-binding factor RbfA [Clostridia bacterium]
MPKYKRQRVNDSVMQEISLIVREVKDPRVGMITVTGAEVSGDLKYAKIFFSAFDGDVKETMKGLKSASGFIRSQLARRLNLRATPELTFVHDNSVSHGAEIAAILSTLDIHDDEGTENEDGDV